jgi:ABC1 atypical kinase-like domain
MIIRFLFSGPARVRLLHADPHPGNFRLLADGRLGVLDFGAVDRLPDGFLPSSYVLIHRASASGLGVLCQFVCEAPFRAEVLRWIPGYVDPAKPGPQPQPACGSAPRAGSAPPATAGGHAGSAPQAGRRSRKGPCRRPEWSRKTGWLSLCG